MANTILITTTVRAIDDYTFEDLMEEWKTQIDWTDLEVSVYLYHTLTTRLSSKPCDCMDCQHDRDLDEREEAIALHHQQAMREFYNSPSDWEVYQKELADDLIEEFGPSVFSNMTW